MLKEIRNEALELTISNFTSSYHGCHLDTSGSVNSVRNLPKQKSLFDCSLALKGSMEVRVSSASAQTLPGALVG